MTAQWAPDPTGVFTHRYWDGTTWTDHVAIDGKMSTSPMGATSPQAEQTAEMLSPTWPSGGTPAPPPAAPTTSAQAGSGVAGAAPQVVIAGRPVSSIGRRFCAWVLDFVLLLVTLVIGWMIWGLFTAANGQTPAKKLMGMQCVNVTTGQTLSWPTFVLVRGGIGLVGGLIASATVIGYAIYLLPFFNDKNQHFYGLMTNSTYVDL